MWDVAIVGSGPAGASCAAFCASAGLRTFVVERAIFPREKVCGDCLNPTCWPVLERLGVAGAVRAAPHGKLSAVDFIGVDGRTVSSPLPTGAKAEIAIKRSVFDQILLQRARSLGAEVRESETVTVVRRDQENWNLATNNFSEQAKVLVAADGRNSTVARLCNLMPRKGRDRVALQTHIPLPRDFGDRVVLQLLPQGYSGQAPVDDNLLNLCLVSQPNDLPAIKSWAEGRIRDFSRAWLADDRAARSRRAAPKPAGTFSRRRCRTRGRAIHRRRDLLRTTLRRTRSGSHRSPRLSAISRVTSTALRRPSLDQCARAPRGRASAFHQRTPAFLA